MSLETPHVHGSASSSSSGSGSSASVSASPSSSESSSPSSTASNADSDASASPESFLNGQISELAVLREVAGSISHALMLKDRVGKYRYVNDYLCELIGRSREEVIGKSDGELFGAEVGAEIRQREMKAYAKKEPISYQETFPIDGEARSFKTKRIPILGDQGAVVATIGISEDITSERSIYQEKQQSQATYRSIIDRARDSIYVLSTNGEILDTNSSLCAMIGRPPQELIGTPFTEILVERRTDVKELRSAVEDALCGEPRRLEVWAEREDGSPFPMDVQLQKITYFGSTAVLGIGRDVTDQKAHESSLRAAKEEAEEAAQLKSAMLANVSHEIRTPLTSIIGFSEVLEEDLDGQPAYFVGKIRRSGERLMETLNSVLELSRLDAGEYNLKTEHLDVRAVVEETAQMFVLEAEQKSVDLATDIPSHPVSIQSDRNALNRILANLVHNAVKFTPSGGRVRVRLTDDDETVEIEVDDTGVGMSPSFQEEATEAFRQESAGNDREFEGTGLGLAITRHLLESLDGSLHIESAKGDGTCITVRLPYKPGGSGAQSTAVRD